MQSRKYKKLVYGMSLSLLSSWSFAAMFQPHDAFNGFYLGAGLGGGDTTYNQNTVANNIAAANIITFIPASYTISTPYTFSNKLSAQHLIGIINAGYAQTWNHSYLGGEIFLDGSHYRKNVTGSSTLTQAIEGSVVSVGTTATEKNALSSMQGGADLRFGMLYSPTALIYGRIGGVVSRLSLKTSTLASYTFDFANMSFAFPLNGTNHKTTVGLRLGAGIEQFINTNLSFKIDYIYTNYGSIHSNISRTDALEAGNLETSSSETIANHTKTKIMDNAIVLGLSYYL